MDNIVPDFKLNQNKISAVEFYPDTSKLQLLNENQSEKERNRLIK